jgi:hypothetical protein
VTGVFIGGSRHITRLEAVGRRRLDRIVEKGLPVVIGDANGADKAVQRYLLQVIFVLDKDDCVYILHARHLTEKEKGRYRRQRR